MITDRNNIKRAKHLPYESGILNIQFYVAYFFFHYLRYTPDRNSRVDNIIKIKKILSRHKSVFLNRIDVLYFVRIVPRSPGCDNYYLVGVHKNMFSDVL